MRIAYGRNKRSTKTLPIAAAAVLFCLFPVLAAAQTISGFVFEDQGYTGKAGRSMATSGGVGVGNAWVELYHSGGNFMATVQTAANGSYSFTTANGLAVNTTYTIRVVNSTVASQLGGTAGTQLPVQTFSTQCAAYCANATTTGPQVNNVGGVDPYFADPGRNGAGVVPANSLSLATIRTGGAGTATANVDFGFNFFTIVNINNSGQGSLPQFLINASSLTWTSIETTLPAVFMIPDNHSTAAGFHTGVTCQLTTGGTFGTGCTTSGTAGTSAYFSINMNGVALAGLATNNVTIDASNEVTNLGYNPNTISLGSKYDCTGTSTPGGVTVGAGNSAVITYPTTTLPPWTGSTLASVEIQNTGDWQWNISGTSDKIKGLALYRGSLLLNQNSVTAQDNLIGMHPDGTIPTSEQTYFGIQMGNAGSYLSGRTVKHNYVRVNDSDIRNDNGGTTTGDTYSQNEVSSPPNGQTNTFDGILIIGPASYTGDQIYNNYSHDLWGGGIEIGFAGSGTLTGELIESNTVCSNGWQLTGNQPYTYTTPTTESVNIAIWGTTLGSQVTISDNKITNSSGVGILVESAYGFTITKNSIYKNGLTSNLNHIWPGIALFSQCGSCDPNGFAGTGSQYTGILGNPGTTSSTAPNNQMNYPVITLATYNGTKLRVKGYVGGATNLAVGLANVELFIADNSDTNQNGPIFVGDGLSVPHGEGTQYICSFAADATGNFDVQLPNGTTCTSLNGVTITAGSTVLTSTATSETGTSIGSTSEFGPNVTVQADAVTISGYVYMDANHNGVLDWNPATDTGEGWMTGTQTMYVSLWNGTTQVCSGGATPPCAPQTVPAGGQYDTGFYSFNNLPLTLNTTGTYTIVLSTTATPTGVASAGIPAGYVMTSPSSPTITVNWAAATGTTNGTTAIANQNFGLFQGLKLSGTIFNDDGLPTGTANNGFKDGTETGYPNVTLTLKDSSGTPVTATTVTDGGGNYSFWLPTASTNPWTLTVAPLGNNYAFTGYQTGTPAVTVPSFVKATQAFSFTVAFTNTTYTGVNLGFVASGNNFAPNGAETTVPGSSAIYKHVYSSITAGTVTFVETTGTSQPNYFTSEVLYSDPTCSGNLATATYLAWNTGVMTLTAANNYRACVILKEDVSLMASLGMTNTVTVTATFAYTGGTGVTVPTPLTVQDVTTIGTRTSGELTLVKSAYVDTSAACTNTPTYQTTLSSAQSQNCIKYQIQASNDGSSPISGLTINDYVPAYTSIQGTPTASVSASCTNGSPGLTVNTASATGNAVQASFNGNMVPGCVATMLYVVKLN